MATWTYSDSNTTWTYTYSTSQTSTSFTLKLETIKLTVGSTSVSFSKNLDIAGVEYPAPASTSQDYHVLYRNPAAFDLSAGASKTWTPNVTYTATKTNAPTAMRLSQGNHVSSNITVPALPTPQITVKNAYRCDSSGNAADEGTCAAIECEFKVCKLASGNNSVASNGLYCTLTRPEGNPATVTQYATLSSNPGMNQYAALDLEGDWHKSACTFVITDAGMSTDTAYSATISLTDSQGGNRTATALVTIATAFYTMDILEGGHGICFGGVAKEEVFEVDMPAVFTRFAGVIQMYAGATPPLGWLKCEGQAVSRAEYSALFAAIGTTWGAGNGTTTFNLPDLRGRAPIGVGTGSGLTARTLAGTGGSEKLQSHNHSLTGGVTSSGTCSITSSGGHTHTITTKTANIRASGNLGMAWSGGSTTSTSFDSIAANTGTHTHTVPNHTHTHNLAVSNKGDGNAENMQPFAVVNFIICTGTIG